MRRAAIALERTPPAVPQPAPVPAEVEIAELQHPDATLGNGAKQGKLSLPKVYVLNESEPHAVAVPVGQPAQELVREVCRDDPQARLRGKVSA
jgi:hypothetical protein